MSKRTRDIGRAVAIALGALPVVAVALDNRNGATTASPSEPACVTGAVGPMSMSLEPAAGVTKDAPYSGVGTSEVVTTLADGNRITRTNTMRYFRDSAGRMRTEYQLAAIGPFVPEEAQSIVTITDPVAARRYVLHPSMKRADVFKISPNSADARTAGAIFVGGAFTSVREGAAGVSVGGSAGAGVGPGRAGLVQAPTRGARIEMPNARGGDRAPKMMGPPISGTTAVAPMGGAAPMSGQTSSSGTPAGGAAPAFNMMIAQPGVAVPVCKGGEMKTAEPISIGERNIEGLKVTGSRLEFTIDAGKVGNEQPITVRTDQWFSPDLGVVVSSTHHDPMIGDTTYRLEQINRVEPDAALFVVPEGYTKNPVGF